MKKIGLFGYGVVAQGFYKILTENPQLNAEVVKVCVKSADKKRDLPTSLVTTHSEEILLNDGVDIVIELIDDAEAAYSICKSALEAGKTVISANKKMIAENIEEVGLWHERYEAPFLYEAAVAGSIPILQNLTQFFGQQPVHEIRGILNGSTNYILSAMRQESLSMNQALAKAQELGFAESDPSLDISGQDAFYKLAILAYHAFGITETDPLKVRIESITNMEDQFYQLADQQGLKIKSVATASLKDGKLKMKVQPELIYPDDDLFGVEYENNAVVVKGGYSGSQLYQGKGAGSLPTGTAVINDLSLALQGFSYRHSNVKQRLKKSA